MIVCTVRDAQQAVKPNLPLHILSGLQTVCLEIDVLVDH